MSKMSEKATWLWEHRGWLPYIATGGGLAVAAVIAPFALGYCGGPSATERNTGSSSAAAASASGKLACRTIIEQADAAATVSTLVTNGQAPAGSNMEYVLTWHRHMPARGATAPNEYSAHLSAPGTDSVASAEAALVLPDGNRVFCGPAKIQ